MDFTEGTALEIVERLSSAYSVSTQKALADCLGVPAANVSNWVQRDSVPGSAFVKCALDTGSDLHWLTTGKLANANLGVEHESPKGEALYNKIISNGGKPVLRRIMDAYGFNLQKQLCELLGISSGTVSTWVRRDYFPGDVVVTCALDTGVSLNWLATGEGSAIKKNTEDEGLHDKTIKIKKTKLISGKLIEDDWYYFDFNFIPSGIEQPILVESASASWLCDFSKSDISNGRWIIDIDGNCDVYDVSRIPGNKISIVGKGSNFECSANEVTPLGVVIKTFENNT